MSVGAHIDTVDQFNNYMANVGTTPDENWKRIVTIPHIQTVTDFVLGQG